MQSVQMENPKVFSSFLVIWITMANYLNFNIFIICPEYDYTERNGQLAKWSNDQLVNFFLFKFTSPFPVQFNIRFAFIKSCHSRPYILLKAYLACQ